MSLKAQKLISLIALASIPVFSAIENWDYVGWKIYDSGLSGIYHNIAFLYIATAVLFGLYFVYRNGGKKRTLIPIISICGALTTWAYAAFLCESESFGCLGYLFPIGVFSAIAYISLIILVAITHTKES